MLEEHLSRGEKIYLHRNRLRETQREYGKRHGVSQALVTRWERGLRKSAPDIKLGGLDPYEHYIVLRLRAGLSRVELGRRAGLRPRYVWGAEHGEDFSRIVSFWGD